MERITLEQGIYIIQQNVFSIKQSGNLPILDCLGKILASSITAPISIPPFNRSPYDGYGVIAKDIALASFKNPIHLNMTKTFMAGDDSSDFFLQSGETVRVMTGTMLPNGVDCVVPQEQTLAENNTVSFFQPLSSGKNVCKAGEDIVKDSIVLTKGTKLNASDLGILASLGYTTAPVFKTPSIALISTGTELTSDGQLLPYGKIYDTNLPYLQARLKELGIDVSTFSASDDKNQLKYVIAHTASQYDFVLTTGGVSVGEKDLLPIVLKELSASILFHGLLIKPGSPAMFSILNNRPILCLSGNPPAAAVTFELLARPILERLTSDSSFLLKKVKGTLLSTYPKASNVRRFVKGYYEKDSNTIVIPNNKFEHTNCIIDVSKGSPPLEASTIVNAFLL